MKTGSEHTWYIIKCHEVLSIGLNLHTKNELKLHALPVRYVYEVTINQAHWYNLKQYVFLNQ